MGNPLDASPGSLSAVALSLKTAEAEIELEKWKLFKKEIDFDKKTIHVHYNNLLTHQWTTASERDRWRTKVRKDHGLAAKKSVGFACFIAGNAYKRSTCWYD